MVSWAAISGYTGAAGIHRRRTAAQLDAIVAEANAVDADFAEAFAGFGRPSTNGHRSASVRAVDYHTFKESPIRDPRTGAGSGLPDPVGRLGLPNYNPGTLSLEETRTVYAHGELRMHQLNEELISQGVSPEERARGMFDQRNALRSWTRDLMADRASATQLSTENPNLTWDQVLEKWQARGVQPPELWDSIIDGSTRSRASVNVALGIDPDSPPPLPPVRPPPV